MENQNANGKLSLFDVREGIQTLSDLVWNTRKFERTIKEVEKQTYGHCDDHDEQTDQIKDNVSTLIKEFYSPLNWDQYHKTADEEMKKILIDEQTEQRYYKCLNGIINVVRDKTR